MTCRFLIKDLRLMVNLGCTEVEQNTPQLISIDIVLNLKNEPHGCISDNLSDTICYADIVSSVRTSMKGRRFHLIEHVNHCLHDSMFAALCKGGGVTSVSVSVCKLAPPIKGLYGGVTFTSERQWYPFYCGCFA